MKVFKSGLCLALTLSIVLGMTGCSAGGFSHKTLCDLEVAPAELPDGMILQDPKKDKRYNYAEEKQFYINAKDEDALPIFYTQIDNSRNSLDHDNVSEVTCLYDYTAPIITDDQEDLTYAEAFGTYSVIVLVSYDDKDDAKGFFEEEIEALNLDDEDVAKSKGCSYVIKCNNVEEDMYKMSALYLKGNSVLVIFGATNDFDVIEEACKKFGIVSPLDA